MFISLGKHAKTRRKKGTAGAKDDENIFGLTRNKLKLTTALTLMIIHYDNER
jgi:hypothetical protein